MISKQMQREIAGSSAIRAMFLEGKELARQVGGKCLRLQPWKSHDACTGLL